MSEINLDRIIFLYKEIEILEPGIKQNLEILKEIYKTIGKNLEEINEEKIVSFIKSNGTAIYSEDILESIENNNKSDKELTESTEDDDTDPFLMDAIQTVVETGQASTSFIQRKFKVGYARAGRIIDQMEERGVISGYQGSKPREVLMSLEKLNELKMGTKEEI